MFYYFTIHRRVAAILCSVSVSVCLSVCLPASIFPESGLHSRRLPIAHVTYSRGSVFRFDSLCYVLPVLWLTSWGIPTDTAAASDVITSSCAGYSAAVVSYSLCRILDIGGCHSALGAGRRGRNLRYSRWRYRYHLVMPCITPRKVSAYFKQGNRRHQTPPPTPVRCFPLVNQLELYVEASDPCCVVYTIFASLIPSKHDVIH